MSHKEHPVPEITPTLPSCQLATEPAAATRELPGWMVLGITTEADGNNSKPLAVPVLAPTASAAMALAAGHHAGFQPVGILSEKELLNHLQSINHHRNTFAHRA